MKEKDIVEISQDTLGYLLVYARDCGDFREGDPFGAPDYFPSRRAAAMAAKIINAGQGVRDGMVTAIAALLLGRVNAPKPEIYRASRDIVTLARTMERAEITRLRAELEAASFAQKVVRDALQWFEDHRVPLQSVGPGTIPIWVSDGWALHAAIPAALSSSPGERAPTPSAPTGWKLAPVEPTLGMIAAGVDARDTPGRVGRVRDVYCAMLSASPSPEDTT